MEFKHTPGPWHLVQKDEETVYLCMTDEQVEQAKRTYGWQNLHNICLYGSDLNQSRPSNKIEARANAKLISIAPEMLEFLIKEDEKYSKSGGLSADMMIQWDKIKELIKKATQY